MDFKKTGIPQYSIDDPLVNFKNHWIMSQPLSLDPSEATWS